MPKAQLELGCLFFVVCEHDLTMDALMENGLIDIRCCYHA